MDTRTTVPSAQEAAGERWCPIQERRVPRIPWADAEIAYRAYVHCGGRGQSLERLAARGGFGLIEYQAFRMAAEHFGPKIDHYGQNVSAKFDEFHRQLYDANLAYYGAGQPVQEGWTKAQVDRWCYQMRDTSFPAKPPPGPYVAEYFVPIQK